MGPEYHQMNGSSDLLEHGYVHLPDFLPPHVTRNFLRQLWKDLREQNVPIRAPDKSVLKKHALEIHSRDYMPMATFHWGMTAAISKVVGSDLLPSYAYFRLYAGGDVCLVHSDRPASEYSISLTLAYSDDKPWGLSIGTLPVADSRSRDDDFGDEPHETIMMREGGALLYQGSLRRHGRVEPNPNKWSAHLFLQWVSKDGPHREYAFEGIAPPGEESISFG
jgi:hypothetical protein